MSFRLTYVIEWHDGGKEFTEFFDDRNDAERQGVKVGRTRGCQSVEVFSPDGILLAFLAREAADSLIDSETNTPVWQRPNNSPSLETSEASI